MSANYFLIGHISKDLAAGEPAGFKLGGGVVYSGLAASVLGAKVGILTSYPKDLHAEVKKGPGATMAIKNLPSRSATVFKNEYRDGGRVQYLLGTASPITAAGFLKSDFAKGYFRPSIIHLAPIAREVDSSLFSVLNADFVGASLQGWLRKRDSRDRVSPGFWPNYRNYLKKIDAAVLSEEDIAHDLPLAKEFANYASVLVLTRGKNGCAVYSKGGRKDYRPSKQIAKNDATGAGDVFAAGFFSKFYQTKNLDASAEFANALAGFHIKKGVANL